MKVVVTLKDLREATPIKSFIKQPISVVICRLLSPIISLPAIRYGVHPNIVTMMMIVSGFIGGVLFMMPSYYCKIMGVVVYFLWFIFDCADGEVARFTKQFSKYGKQLDWAAHMVCHPTFVLAVWCSFYQEKTANMSVLSIICILLISMELIGRIRIMWDVFLFNNTINPSNESPSPNTSIAKLFAIKGWSVSDQVLFFPNMVLIYPVLYLISVKSNYDIAYYTFISWSLIYIIAFLISFIKVTYYMYSER